MNQASTFATLVVALLIFSTSAQTLLEAEELRDFMFTE